MEQVTPTSKTTYTPPTHTEERERMETPYMTMWMEDDFICCKYNNDLHVTLEVAKACVEIRLYFSRGKKYPLLIDMTGIKSSTQDARVYLASVGTTLVKAGALIVGSAISKALGTMFLTVDKPPIPCRLFTNREKAKLWLMNYR